MRPTKLTLAKRLDEIMQIRLDGATFYDARRYVAEKEAAGEEPWTIQEGGRPVSERTLWRYIAQTDRMMAETCRESRKRLVRRHLAQRRNLYAKCVSMGDMRAALSCLDSEGKILGLFDIEEVREMRKTLDELAAKINELSGGGNARA